MRNYSVLLARPLPTVARVSDIALPRVENGHLDAPALAVMTDFRAVPAALIEPTAGMDEAHTFMSRRRVRALLVMEGEGQIAGLVTATDILGERPMQVARERGLTRRELVVRDIMTSRERLDALSFEDVRHASVGHVVATLKQSGRQHALVMEQGTDGCRVRGIFSVSQIARQLGVNLQTTEVAQTFAEIEAALSR